MSQLFSFSTSAFLSESSIIVKYVLMYTDANLISDTKMHSLNTCREIFSVLEETGWIIKLIRVPDKSSKYCLRKFVKFGFDLCLKA